MMMDTMRRFHAGHPVIPEIQGTMNNSALAAIRIHCTSFALGDAKAITAQTMIAIATTTLNPEPPE